MIKIDFSLNKSFYRRRRCVLCDSTNIKEVLNFKKTPLANSYPSSKKTIQEYFPLSTILCKNCGHLQLKEIVSPKKMFLNYLYVSGTSKVLVNHFKNYCDKMVSKFKLKKNDFILDIACNDGTFLECFVKKKFKNVVGVEPAKNLRKLNEKKNIKINTIFFDEQKSKILEKKYKKFKLITANNVFAHVPDLKSFALGVKNILDKKGVFVFEVSYLLDVINKLSFDTIYHEHMSYHSLKPLIKFFDKLNMSVFDLDLIQAQGGSLRVYVCHKNSRKINNKKINNQIIKEVNRGLFTTKLYKNYLQRMQIEMNKFQNFIKKYNSKYIFGFGAPAKLTTFSHFFKIKRNQINSIVDDNKLKQKRFSPGQKFPIISFAKLQKLKCEIIIIFAWNFSASIIMKLKKVYKGKNIKVVIPFPKLKVINL